jgi:RNA polymerase sigma-70 factor (ECF subfamily)
MSTATDLVADASRLGGVAVQADAREVAEARVREAVAAHASSVWRTLRRLGVREPDVDDGVQQVFTVFARRSMAIAVGAERSFLLGTAARIAADYRRSLRRRRDELAPRPLPEPSDEGGASPELLLERRRGLVVLDRILGELSEQQRLVLVLCEIEGLSLPEVAKLLATPLGTVASRLHRARQRFEKACRAMEKPR